MLSFPWRSSPWSSALLYTRFAAFFCVRGAGSIPPWPPPRDPCQPWTIPRPWRRSPSSPRRVVVHGAWYTADPAGPASAEHPLSQIDPRPAPGSRGVRVEEARGSERSQFARRVRVDFERDDGRREHPGQRAEDARKKRCPERADTRRRHEVVSACRKQRRDRPEPRAWVITTGIERVQGHRASVAPWGGSDWSPRRKTPVGRRRRRRPPRVPRLSSSSAHAESRRRRPGNKCGGFVRVGDAPRPRPPLFVRLWVPRSATAVATVAPVTVTSGDTMLNAVLSAFSID